MEKTESLPRDVPNCKSGQLTKHRPLRRDVGQTPASAPWSKRA